MKTVTRNGVTYTHLAWGWEAAQVSGGQRYHGRGDTQRTALSALRAQIGIPDEHRRRTKGICWSCATLRPVRLRSFWTTGLRKPLCAACEKQFALNTGVYTSKG